MGTRWIVIMALIALCGTGRAEFVTIGHAGNAADPATGGVYGDVAYIYRISKTEVTIAEIAASGAGNGNEGYWNDGTRTVGSNAPATYVSLYEAMKYCNYLTSGNVTNGVYKFSGGVYQSTDRNSALATYGTIYALPTEDEWYKAAYFKSDASGYSLYANGTDTAPTWGTTNGWNYDKGSYVNSSPNYIWTAGCGGVEQNGTYDMMGNVSEWVEDASGVIRGGSYNYNELSLNSSSRSTLSPVSQYSNFGFRVVAIPEPATAMLLLLGGCVAWLVRLKQRL